MTKWEIHEVVLDIMRHNTEGGHVKVVDHIHYFSNTPLCNWGTYTFLNFNRDIKLF